MTGATGHGEARAIVVGVDGSEPALRAVRWSVREAADRAATLVLVHATNAASLYAGPAGAVPVTADVVEALQREAAEVLNAAQRVAAEVGGVEVRTLVDAEAPAVALRHASRTARLLVLGASGRGTLGTALGSVTLAVASHAECPAVLVGVDGGPLSDTALAHAFDAAATRGAPLRALHVWSDRDIQRSHLGHYFELAAWEQMKHVEERALAERLAGWSERYPDIAVERRIGHDDPPRALVELSEDSSLVVVATRGRGGFSGLLLGSTGLALIQLAHCPVMLVGPESRPVP